MHTIYFFLFLFVNLKKHFHSHRLGHVVPQVKDMGKVDIHVCDILLYYKQQKWQNEDLSFCHLSLFVPEFALSPLAPWGKMIIH